MSIGNSKNPQNEHTAQNLVLRFVRIFVGKRIDKDAK